MNAVSLPLAYKYVAIAVMLTEINFCARQLGLQSELPISQESLRLEHVAHPFVSGFGGTFETKRYAFVFFKSGRLRAISRNRDTFVPSSGSPENTLRITEIQAYALASNWLSSIATDIPALEKSFHHSVYEISSPLFTEDVGNSGAAPASTYIPILHVDWGTKTEPQVRVALLASTGELLAIYLENESFSQRPKELIKNVDELLKIEDADFAKYSPAERATLLAHFAIMPIPTNLVSSKDFDLPTQKDRHLPSDH